MQCPGEEEDKKLRRQQDPGRDEGMYLSPEEDMYAVKRMVAITPWFGALHFMCSETAVDEA